MGYFGLRYVGAGVIWGWGYLGGGIVGVGFWAHGMIKYLLISSTILLLIVLANPKAGTSLPTSRTNRSILGCSRRWWRGLAESFRQPSPTPWQGSPWPCLGTIGLKLRLLSLTFYSYSTRTFRINDSDSCCKGSQCQCFETFDSSMFVKHFALENDLGRFGTFPVNAGSLPVINAYAFCSRSLEIAVHQLHSLYFTWY